MPRPATGREPVIVRLDPDDREWLDQQAAAEDINRSQMLRRIVRQARLGAPTAEGQRHEPAASFRRPDGHRHLRTVIRPKVGNRPALFGCTVPGCAWTREDT